MTDLNAYAYFAAVVEHGGFAAASRVLGIPKSRLSRHVALLEARLGVRLLQRSTRRFALTDTGAALLPHCRALVAEARAAESLAASRTVEPLGRVQLSCPPALLGHAAQAMLDTFLHRWPGVQLRVTATNRNVDVWEYGVDIALRVRPQDAALPAEEIVRPLALSPHLLVAAPAVLQHRSPPLHPRDLGDFPALGLGNSPEAHRWSLRDATGEPQEVLVTPRLVVDDMQPLLQAALDGLGCAVLPRLFVHEALQQGTLVQVLPGWHAPTGVIQAAYASRQGMRPAVRELLDHLAQGFRELARQGRCLLPPEAQPV